MDTIAAIASPPGPGERGVIRLSGPRAGEVVAACLRADGPVPPPDRGLVAGRLDDGAGEQPALLLWMPGPRSYTREDVAELHLPGSPPLLDAALARLLALGARAARPGEFTRRAFTSGRIDLLAAEAVLELVSAAGRGEARAAAALLCGGLSARVGELRAELVELCALVEASLDFDESETGHVDEAEVLARADAALAGLGDALRAEERRAPVAGRPRLALFGAPNAGKSTLFNALARDRAALVSPRAGTTRDGVTGEVVLGDVACELLDAPGLEADLEEGGPDRAAQVLAAGEREGADLVLWVVDAARDDLAAACDEVTALPPGAAVVLVWNGVDRPGARPSPPAALAAGRAGSCATSALSGAGLDDLRAAAARALGLAGAARGAGAGAARELAARHRAALSAARDEVARARAGVAAGAPLDLSAQALRAALQALDDVTGRTTPEDVLDALFARFCIGK